MTMRRLIACAGLALAAATPSRAEPLPPPHVSVSGHGEVSAAPDRARLRLGVTQVAPEVHGAERAVNAIVRSTVAAARKLGARDEDIATSALSVQPEYVWDDQTREQKLSGYRVTRDIQITVRDLDRLGDYLLAATAAGVNQMQPPALESSRAEDLGRQALVAAAQDARARAALLAGTLDASLGRALSIDAVEAPTPQPIMMQMRAKADAAAADGNSEMGLSTGEIRFAATVNARFELLGR